MMTPKSVKPSSSRRPTAIESKDGDGVTCVEKAFTMMTGGADVLDALVAGVSIVELDPNQTGVGWSGLPNADGVVQLDSCCMHGPKKRAGGVAGIEGVRAPAKVAQLVADETDHHLLVGKGAQEFARRDGHQDRGRPHQRERRASSGSNGSAAPIRCTTSIPKKRRRRGTTPACRWCARG